VKFSFTEQFPPHRGGRARVGVIVNLSVGFASMSYSVDGYGLLAIGNFIEDSIGADSDSVFGLTTCEFNA